MSNAVDGVYRIFVGCVLCVRVCVEWVCWVSVLSECVRVCVGCVCWVSVLAVCVEWVCACVCVSVKCIDGARDGIYFEHFFEQCDDFNGQPLFLSNFSTNFIFNSEFLAISINLKHSERLFTVFSLNLRLFIFSPNITPSMWKKNAVDKHRLLCPNGDAHIQCFLCYFINEDAHIHKSFSMETPAVCFLK